MKKAGRANEADWFEEIPNVGKRVANDFKKLGFKTPEDLKGKNPYKLYDTLCKKDGVRHDPCLLDTFIAAIHFMNGGKPTPWWKFTPERKKKTSTHL